MQETARSTGATSYGARPGWVLATFVVVSAGIVSAVVLWSVMPTIAGRVAVITAVALPIIACAALVDHRCDGRRRPLPPPVSLPAARAAPTASTRSGGPFRLALGTAVGAPTAHPAAPVGPVRARHDVVTVVGRGALARSVHGALVLQLAARCGDGDELRAVGRIDPAAEPFVTRRAPPPTVPDDVAVVRAVSARADLAGQTVVLTPESRMPRGPTTVIAVGSTRCVVRFDGASTEEAPADEAPADGAPADDAAADGATVDAAVVVDPVLPQVDRSPDAWTGADVSARNRGR